MKFEQEAKEIVGMCNAVFRHDDNEKGKSELIKKIANKIDLICSDECSDCEYYNEAERDKEPLFDPNDLD